MPHGGRSGRDDVLREEDRLGLEPERVRAPGRRGQERRRLRHVLQPLFERRLLLQPRGHVDQVDGWRNDVLDSAQRLKQRRAELLSFGRSGFPRRHLARLGGRHRKRPERHLLCSLHRRREDVRRPREPLGESRSLDRCRGRSGLSRQPTRHVDRRLAREPRGLLRLGSHRGFGAGRGDRAASGRGNRGRGSCGPLRRERDAVRSKRPDDVDMGFWRRHDGRGQPGGPPVRRARASTS